MKPIVKALSSRITVRTYERAMTYALLREEFPETQTLREYPDKPAIWSAAIEAAGGREAPITYVEFGVYDATGSFRYFLENNTNFHWPGQLSRATGTVREGGRRVF